MDDPLPAPAPAPTPPPAPAPGELNPLQIAAGPVVPPVSSGDSDRTDVYEVEKITGICLVVGKLWFRVRWKGYNKDVDTWEPRENLLSCEELLDEYVSKVKGKKYKQGKRRKLQKTLLSSRQGEQHTTGVCQGGVTISGQVKKKRKKDFRKEARNTYYTRVVQRNWYVNRGQIEKIETDPEEQRLIKKESERVASWEEQGLKEKGKKKACNGEKWSVKNKGDCRDPEEERLIEKERERVDSWEEQQSKEKACNGEKWSVKNKGDCRVMSWEERRLEDQAMERWASREEQREEKKKRKRKKRKKRVVNPEDGRLKKNRREKAKNGKKRLQEKEKERVTNGRVSKAVTYRHGNGQVKLKRVVIRELRSLQALLEFQRRIGGEVKENQMETDKEEYEHYTSEFREVCTIQRQDKLLLRIRRQGKGEKIGEKEDELGDTEDEVEKMGTEEVVLPESNGGDQGYEAEEKIEEQEEEEEKVIEEERREERMESSEEEGRLTGTNFAAQELEKEDAEEGERDETEEETESSDDNEDDEGQVEDKDDAVIDEEGDGIKEVKSDAVAVTKEHEKNELVENEDENIVEKEEEEETKVQSKESVQERKKDEDVVDKEEEGEDGKGDKAEPLVEVAVTKEMKKDGEEEAVEQMEEGGEEENGEQMEEGDEMKERKSKSQDVGFTKEQQEKGQSRDDKAVDEQGGKTCEDIFQREKDGAEVRVEEEEMDSEDVPTTKDKRVECAEDKETQKPSTVSAAVNKEEGQTKSTEKDGKIEGEKFDNNVATETVRDIGEAVDKGQKETKATLGLTTEDDTAVEMEEGEIGEEGKDTDHAEDKDMIETDNDAKEMVCNETDIVSRISGEFHAILNNASKLFSKDNSDGASKMAAEKPQISRANDPSDKRKAKHLEKEKTKITEINGGKPPAGSSSKVASDVKVAQVKTGAGAAPRTGTTCSLEPRGYNHACGQGELPTGVPTSKVKQSPKQSPACSRVKESSSAIQDKGTKVVEKGKKSFRETEGEKSVGMRKGSGTERGVQKGKAETKAALAGQEGKCKKDGKKQAEPVQVATKEKSAESRAISSPSKSQSSRNKLLQEVRHFTSRGLKMTDLICMKRFLVTDNAECLVEACAAITKFMDSNDIKINLVVKKGFCPMLVELLRSPSNDVVSSALLAVSHIVSGNDYQTQAVLECSPLPLFRNLLDRNRFKVTIRKEACLALSNITAGTSKQIQHLVDADLFRVLLDAMLYDQFLIQYEATWAVANATVNGSPEQIRFIVKQGFFKAFCEVIKHPNEILIQIALDAIHNVLKLDAKNGGGKKGQAGQYSHQVKQYGGLHRIKSVKQLGPTVIRRKAYNILTTFFKGDYD